MKEITRSPEWEGWSHLSKRQRHTKLSGESWELGEALGRKRLLGSYSDPVSWGVLDTRRSASVSPQRGGIVIQIEAQFFGASVRVSNEHPSLKHRREGTGRVSWSLFWAGYINAQRLECLSAAHHKAGI